MAAPGKANFIFLLMMKLTTDGKGGTQPVDKGTTAESKANNRRVEFVKL
jgi:outer membrane protein OmpA-like peptidoglycan-associated protein